MPKARFTLADLALTGGLKRLSKTPIRTRQERLAAAPAPPISMQVQYMRGLNALLDGLRVVSLDILEPLFIVQSGMSSDIPLSKIKQDADETAALFDKLRIRLGDLTEEPALIELVGEIARGLNRKNAADISRILGIDLTSDGALNAYLGGFIRDNVRLIQSVTFEHLGRMEEVVRQAQAGQVRVEGLRQTILGTFDVTRSRAALIARDQVLKANADLTQVRQQRVGITEYIWTTSADERVRGRPGGVYEDTPSNHWVLDGTRQSWLSPPVTNPVTGERNHPGRDYQCRCTATPVTDGLLSDL